MWEPIRVMVANRLASSGEEWGQVFARRNSGTYSNQWMVVEQARGRLWVTEQLPGTVTTRSPSSTESHRHYQVT